MADSSTTGIIVTQGGVPVKGAADYQKTIDTRWRFLDILDEKEVDMVHADSGSSHYWLEKLMDHNLGYLPAFSVRTLSRDLGGLDPNFIGSNFQIISDTKAIYLRNLYINGDPTTPLKYRFFIRVFKLDITQEYKAPTSIIVPGAAPSYSNVGVKVLKNSGAGMRSTDMTDYSMNTFAKALAIQQTGVRNAGTSGSFTVVHGLGYPPTYFFTHLQRQSAWNSVFANPLPVDVIEPLTVGSTDVVRADAQNLIVSGSQAALQGEYPFLITKEPQELAV